MEGFGTSNGKEELVACGIVRANIGNMTKQISMLNPMTEFFLIITFDTSFLS